MKERINKIIIFILCLIVLIPKVDASITNLEIIAPSDKIPLDPDNYELKMDINITPSDSSENIIWRSNNPTIITISNEGIIKPVALGTATIEACTLDETICDEANIEVVSNTTIYPVKNSKFLYLYSDGLLYARISYSYLKLVDYNVIDLVGSRYLTKNHKLYTVSYTYNGEYISNFSTRLHASDAQKVYDYAYINLNNELFKLNYASVGDKIFDNVRYYYNNTFITNNDELYVYGENIYGQKINNGTSIAEPILLAEDIKQVGDHYYLTNEGELYIFNEHLLRPTLLDTQVTSVKYMYYDSSYWDNVFIYQKEEAYYYGNVKTNNYQIINVSNIYTDDSYKYVDYFGVNNRIGYINTNNQFCILDFCLNDVKYVSDLNNANYIYYITQNNELYFLDLTSSTIKHYPELLATGAKKFINDKLIVMENGDIWENINYGKLPYELYRSTSPYIKSASIVYDADTKTDITIDDTQDILVTILPLNATNNALSWETSNNELAEIDNTGLLTAKKSGVVTITATTIDNVSKDLEINIHPKPNKVTIENKDEEHILLVSNYEYDPNYIYLTAYVSPDEAIDRRVEWSSSNTAMVTIFPDDDGSGYTSRVRIAERGNVGEVTIYAKTSDGNYQDSINIKLVRQYQTIEYNDININLRYGNTIKLEPDSVIPNDFDTSYITYEATSDNILIDENNYLHILNDEPGYYTVNVKIFGNFYREIHINVEKYEVENPYLESVYINGEPFEEFETYVMEYDLGDTQDASITFDATPYYNDYLVMGNMEYQLAYGINTIFINTYKPNTSTYRSYKFVINRLPEYPKGDLNKNNRIDLQDIIMLLKLYLGNLEYDPYNEICGDIDDNGSITLLDVISLLKLYLNGD